MNRKAIALACAGLLLLTTAACSSSSDDEADETTTTTAAAESTETTAPAADSSGTITAEESACINQAAAAEPALAAYDPTTISSAPQEAQEVYYGIVVNCAGGQKIIDLFMVGFSSNANMDEAQLACVRGLVEALPVEQGVALLAGDPVAKADLTTSITAECA